MKTHHILVLAATCVLTACDRGTSTDSYDAEWEEQQRRTKAQMDDFDRQTKRVDEFQSRSEQHDVRYEKLLDKWEEQARRQDAVLDVQEKQHGIKK